MLVIHGDDKVGSYKDLCSVMDQSKSDNLEVIVYEASDIDLTNIRQETSTEGLFGNPKKIIIKNLLSGTKSKQKEKILEYLSLVDNKDIILYESKSVPSAQLKKIKNSQIREFTIPTIIFKFLDTLRPKNQTSMIIGWKKLLSTDHEQEYIFSMIVRQIRLLIQAKSGQSYLKLAPYPKKMIINQAESFTLDHLLDLHSRLYEIDKAIKTGTSSVNIDHLMFQFLHKI